MLIPKYLLPALIDQSSALYGTLYYLIRAIFILIAIPLMLFLTNFLFTTQEGMNNKNVSLPSPYKSHLNLYKFSKTNFKYQLLYGILLLFIVFIPLDFITYLLIPEMLEYIGEALTSNSTDSYLKASYPIFIISVVIIQISVSIYEESISRGLLAKRGHDCFQKMSAVTISSLYFGFGHFAYFFNPISANYPIWFPIVWFFQSIFVGIILSLVVLRKKWIFPVIFAHALNNLISAHAVWNFLQGNEFVLVALYLYFPLLIMSVALFFWQFKRIKEGIKVGVEDIKSYFVSEKNINESTGDKCVRIIVDVLLAVLIYFVALIT